MRSLVRIKKIAIFDAHFKIKETETQEGVMNDKEKDVVSKMINIYCRSKHKHGRELCAECRSLNEYALQRLERCPFGEEKPTCGTCKIHCYKKDMREQIKTVMRFAGPRMLLHHPIDAITHFHRERKLKRAFSENSV
ncbi:MAG TPA: nitrous oxide-stimulated promoter family protein [Fermentimonas sp.]|nr:nitrous oxide-stimulated promoter family protein [Fermentimonas sp.]